MEIESVYDKTTYLFYKWLYLLPQTDYNAGAGPEWTADHTQHGSNSGHSQSTALNSTARLNFTHSDQLQQPDLNNLNESTGSDSGNHANANAHDKADSRLRKLMWQFVALLVVIVVIQVTQFCALNVLQYYNYSSMGPSQAEDPSLDPLHLLNTFTRARMKKYTIQVNGADVTLPGYWWYYHVYDREQSVLSMYSQQYSNYHQRTGTGPYAFLRYNNYVDTFDYSFDQFLNGNDTQSRDYYTSLWKRKKGNNDRILEMDLKSINKNWRSRALATPGAVPINYLHCTSQLYALDGTPFPADAEYFEDWRHNKILYSDGAPNATGGFIGTDDMLYKTQDGYVVPADLFCSAYNYIIEYTEYNSSSSVKVMNENPTAWVCTNTLPPVLAGATYETCTSRVLTTTNYLYISNNPHVMELKYGDVYMDILNAEPDSSTDPYSNINLYGNFSEIEVDVPDDMQYLYNMMYVSPMLGGETDAEFIFYPYVVMSNNNYYTAYYTAGSWTFTNDSLSVPPMQSSLLTEANAYDYFFDAGTEGMPNSPIYYGYPINEYITDNLTSLSYTNAETTLGTLNPDISPIFTPAAVANGGSIANTTVNPFYKNIDYKNGLKYLYMEDAATTRVQKTTKRSMFLVSPTLKNGECYYFFDIYMESQDYTSPYKTKTILDKSPAQFVNANGKSVQICTPNSNWFSRHYSLYPAFSRKSSLDQYAPADFYTYYSQFAMDMPEGLYMQNLINKYLRDHRHYALLQSIASVLCYIMILLSIYSDSINALTNLYVLSKVYYDRMADLSVRMRWAGLGVWGVLVFLNFMRFCVFSLKVMTVTYVLNEGTNILNLFMNSLSLIFIVEVDDIVNEYFFKQSSTQALTLINFTPSLKQLKFYFNNYYYAGYLLLLVLSQAQSILADFVNYFQNITIYLFVYYYLSYHLWLVIEDDEPYFNQDKDKDYDEALHPDPTQAAYSCSSLVHRVVDKRYFGWVLFVTMTAIFSLAQVIYTLYDYSFFNAFWQESLNNGDVNAVLYFDQFLTQSIQSNLIVQAISFLASLLIWTLFCYLHKEAYYYYRRHHTDFKTYVELHIGIESPDLSKGQGPNGEITQKDSELHAAIEDDPVLKQKVEECYEKYLYNEKLSQAQILIIRGILRDKLRKRIMDFTSDSMNLNDNDNSNSFKSRLKRTLVAKAKSDPTNQSATIPNNTNVDGRESGRQEYKEIMSNLHTRTYSLDNRNNNSNDSRLEDLVDQYADRGRTSQKQPQILSKGTKVDSESVGLTAKKEDRHKADLPVRVNTLNYELRDSKADSHLQLESPRNRDRDRDRKSSAMEHPGLDQEQKAKNINSLKSKIQQRILHRRISESLSLQQKNSAQGKATRTGIQTDQSANTITTPLNGDVNFTLGNQQQQETQENNI